ncbi:MAG: TetR/AcrR family transcriptional regulator [Candidatus Hodarchaeales archaeon]|jgi:AcrR family transcriptional regulator
MVKKRKNSKEVIIQKAISLFLQNGYENVSLNDITEKIGMKKPSIYYYFDSKEKLFREVVNRVLPEITKWTSEFDDPSKPLKEILQSIFKNLGNQSEKLIEMAGSHTIGVHYLMFDAARVFPDLTEELNEFQEGFVKTIIKRINDAKKNKQIREDLEWEAFAFHLMAIVEGASLLKVSNPSIEFGQLGMKIFENFWAGMQ